MSTPRRTLPVFDRRRRAAASGFTLVEVAVSLVAGLIVALGVIALSKEATTSFNDEMRASAAESAVRSAVDRVRLDLQRAAFMSTGNVARDPKIAGGLLLGQQNVSATVAGNYKGLARLAGVHLFFGGSAAATPLSQAQSVAAPAGTGGGSAAPLDPDAIEIAGNFTSNDQFVVRNLDAPGGSCQRVWLAVDSPAMYRILSGTKPSQNLQNAFQPVLSAPGGGGGNAQTYRYIVRVVDDSGHYQYVVTCPTATGGAESTPASPWLDIDASTPILTAKQAGTVGGTAGLGVGRLQVNPVQIVRWELTNSPPTALAKALNPSNDPNKYDLIRSYVDALGNVVPESTEVVAEYAVDLKFAFTVDADLGQIGATDPSTGLAGPQLQTLSFDSPDNALWAPDVSSWLAVGTTVTKGPQRIRSVRVRLVSRTAIPDRQTNIVPNPPNVQASPNATTSELFIYRYCAGQVQAGDGGVAQMPDCTTGTQWARARTVTTEVWLPNQVGMHYL